MSADDGQRERHEAGRVAGRRLPDARDEPGEPGEPDELDELDELEELDEQQVVLGELLNHVLDKGVVITGDVTISVADIDLIRVGLSVFLTAVESAEQRARARDARLGNHADPSVLPAGGGE